MSGICAVNTTPRRHSSFATRAARLDRKTCSRRGRPTPTKSSSATSENIVVNNDPSIISVGNAWTRFWFTPISTIGMQCLRVLSGLLFLFWLLSFLGHQAAFFSFGGWIDMQAYLDIQEVYADMQAQGIQGPRM